MVGTALVNNLKTIQDGRNKTRPNIHIEEIYEYDIDNTLEELDQYCKECNFVFNLAGVNRPENTEDFMKGNFGFASKLLDTLKKHSNKAPIMLSSSVQATLAGRFGNSEYGRSKEAGEELFFEYSEEEERFKATIEKDNTKTKEEALLEIYKRLRPGEPPTVDSAVSLIDSLFFDAKRYDLSDDEIMTQLPYMCH